MHDFTVWVSYGKWRKNWDIRYCLLHLIHLSSTRLRRCGRILSGICEPYCLITPDLTMRYCPILILIDYRCDNLTTKKTIFVISHSDEASEGSVGSDSRSCKGTQYSPVPVTNLKGNGSTTIMHPIGYEHFNIYTHGFWGLYDSMGSTSDIYNQLNKHDGVK